MMKRTISLILALILAAGIMVPASAAGRNKPLATPVGGYVLPEPLKTVSRDAAALPLPDGLPGAIPVTAFAVGEGTVHLELAEAVPRLKIFERKVAEGIESTIYSKKNTAVGDAFMMDKDNAAVTIRMYWKLGTLEYVREYSSFFGSLTFSGGTAVEELDTQAYGSAWTSARRTYNFSETGELLSEVVALTNDDASLTRTVSYDKAGALTSVEVRWSAADYSGYLLDVILDAEGQLIGVTCREKKNNFAARSMRIDERPDVIQQIEATSPDPIGVDEQLRLFYPQLPESITEAIAQATDYDPVAQLGFDPSYQDMWVPEFTSKLPATMTDLQPATMTDLSPADLPLIPVNARIWVVSFGTLIDAAVYAFVTTDPLFIFKNGKAVLNPDARDVNGNLLKPDKKRTAATPVFETVVFE